MCLLIRFIQFNQNFMFFHMKMACWVMLQYSVIIIIRAVVMANFDCFFINASIPIRFIQSCRLTAFGTFGTFSSCLCINLVLQGWGVLLTCHTLPELVLGMCTYLYIVLHGYILMRHYYSPLILHSCYCLYRNLLCYRNLLYCFHGRVFIIPELLLEFPFHARMKEVQMYRNVISKTGQDAFSS